MSDRKEELEAMFVPEENAVIDRVVLHCDYDGDDDEGCKDCSAQVDNYDVATEAFLPGGDSPFEDEIAELVVDGVNTRQMGFYHRCMGRVALGQVIHTKVKPGPDKDHAYLQVWLVVPELAGRAILQTTDETVVINTQNEDTSMVPPSETFGFVVHGGKRWRVMRMCEADYDRFDKQVTSQILEAQHPLFHTARPHLTCHLCVGVHAADRARARRNFMRDSAGVRATAIEDRIDEDELLPTPQVEARIQELLDMNEGKSGDQEVREGLQRARRRARKVLLKRKIGADAEGSPSKRARDV